MLVVIMDQRDLAEGKRRAGLCATCRHMREVRSDRGSVFYQCTLSATDLRFPKYPRLPVVACPGYEEIGPSAQKSG